MLLRFMILYAALFSAFGFASPFLPAFLAERGLGPEELGFVLAASTALRLVCGPVAGHLADRIQAFRAELAVCAIVAATAAFLYLAAQGFWTVMAVSLLQAAALAPLVPLADALSLAHARPRQNTRGFEYGRVRGVGSAAFVAGTLLAGQAVGGYGLSAIMWLSATALLTIPIAACFVPPFPENAARDISLMERFRSSLADAAAPTRVRARHPDRRSRSRQSCHVRHLCRDPLDAGRHQPRNRRRAVGGVGRRRGTRLSILGSKTVASGYTYCRIGGGGIFRADALGSHGADSRRCGAWPCPALARTQRARSGIRRSSE